MKNKQKMVNRARAGIKGLILSWKDKDPLSESAEVIPGAVGHRNPVYRLTAAHLFDQFGDWITTRMPFRWLVTIKLIFDYPNGTTQIEERELEAFATISALNDHCMEQVQDAMRHGNRDHYMHTEFTIECIGSN